MSIVENKRKLRKILINKRKKIDFRTKKDCQIRDYVVKLLLERNVSSLFVYVSMKYEVDTIGIIDKLIPYMRIYVPYTTDGQMSLVPIDKDTTLTNVDKLGNVYCGEKPPRVFSPENVSVDAVIVPMCSYDKKLYRLGYGGGYYDKYLSRVDCFSVGLSYDELGVDSLPIEAHDVPLSVIVTDKGVFFRDNIKV